MPASKYSGETALPVLVQNLHRFSMYGALLFVPILWYGALNSFYNTEEVIDGKVVETGFGVGLGSMLLVVNAFLLMMYTFSCHSFRHCVGGGLDCFSCTAWTRTRKRLWDRDLGLECISHRLWAWSSLVWIVFTDSTSAWSRTMSISDPNTWSGSELG